MAVPKWLDGRTPQEKGRRVEKKLAKKMGGRPQPASGSLPMFREDIITDQHLVQVKRTEKKQITIKLHDLETLNLNAIKKDKLPVFTIIMGGKAWIMVPYDVSRFGSNL